MKRIPYLGLAALTIALSQAHGMEKLSWIEEAFTHQPGQLITYDIPCSDDFLSALPEHPNLDKIAFYAIPETPPTLQFFGHLSQQQNIRELILRGITVDQRDAQVFASLPHLTTLDLNFSRISAQAWSTLGQLPHLMYLSICGVKMVDDHLWKFEPLRLKMKNFYLSGNRLTAKSGIFLGNCYFLETLHLSHNPMGDAGMNDLMFIHNLTTFHADRCGLTDAGVKQIGECSTIKELSLAGNELTDNSVPFLKKLRGLTFLDLSETKVTSTGIKELSQSLSKTKILPTQDEALDVTVLLTALTLSTEPQ